MKTNMYPKKKKKNLPEGCGEMYWSKRLLKWVESERLNSKGTAHKHCTIVNKLSSPGYRSTILILLYIQIQLIKYVKRWQTVEARFLIPGVGVYRQARRVG